MKSNGNNKNVQQFSHTWALLNVLEINFQCVPATLIKLLNKSLAHKIIMFYIANYSCPYALGASPICIR